MSDEQKILTRRANNAAEPTVRRVVTLADIVTSRARVNDVYIDDRIAHYIVSLVDATRHPARYGLDHEKLIRYGASPRATIGLALASRARAYLRGRSYVTPQDVKVLAPSVLGHRVGVTYEADASRVTAAELIARTLEQVVVP